MNRKPPAGELDARILRAEVSLAYGQSRVGFTISLLNGVVFFALLAGVVPLLALSIWLALLVVVSAGRAGLVRAHARADAAGEADGPLWRSRFVVSASIGGAAWGVLGAVLFPAASAPHQLAIGFVLAGLAAGSVSYFSSIPAAYYVFAATSLVPYAMRLFFAGGSLAITLGALTLLYVGALAANVRRVHRVIADSLRAQFANEELVERLRAEVDERKNAEERRAASEELFRGAFEQVAACMCLLDERGRFLRVNDAMCALLGYTVDELLSRALYEIVPGWNAAPLRARFAALVSGGNDEVFEGRVVTKDGRERWVQGSARAVRDAAGASRRFVGQFVDVTERREVDRMKSEFIATVSHELRTPLTAIQGAVDLLAGGVAGPLQETAADLVVTAASNARRLRKLVDDLLDFEKLTSETLAFVKRVVKLGPLLDEVIECAAPFAHQYDVRIERVRPTRLGEGGAELEVETDPDRLGQVITNLLSNAAKFSARGGVVEASVGMEGGRAVVLVRDYGVGIPAQFHARVFEKFSQVDSSDARAKGGTGLGLSISKAIVEKLGGEISFESSPGAGTTFRVALPARLTASRSGDPPADTRRG